MTPSFRSSFPSLLGLLVCLAPLGSQAADPAPPSATPTAREEKLQELDEVTVNGMRLGQMHEAVIAAEDRLFALYNQVNTDHQYDVHCRLEARPAMHIKRRVCWPAFLDEAYQDEANAFFLGDSGAPSPEALMRGRAGEYRDHLVQVMASDPRLQQLVHERAELDRKYQAALAKALKTHKIVTR